MKEASGTCWGGIWGATNSSGFTVLPGGGRYGLGQFGNLGDSGAWWSSSEIQGIIGLDVEIGGEPGVYMGQASYYIDSSVRCLKD